VKGVPARSSPPREGFSAREGAVGSRLHERQRGNTCGMGFLWGLLRAVFTFFAVIVAVLVVIDGTLLANLLGKKE
jgi:hypothetical protein